MSLLTYYAKGRRKTKTVVVPMEPFQVLEEAAKHLDRRDYKETIKYSAEILRTDLTRKLSLNKSLTQEEIIHRVKELRKDIDLEKLRYVLDLGEKCTFGGYRPTKNEAEKALEYSKRLIKEL
jgi:HEPN domain-containing protein